MPSTSGSGRPRPTTVVLRATAPPLARPAVLTATATGSEEWNRQRWSAYAARLVQERPDFEVATQRGAGSASTLSVGRTSSSGRAGAATAPSTRGASELSATSRMLGELLSSVTMASWFEHRLAPGL